MRSLQDLQVTIKYETTRMIVMMVCFVLMEYALLYKVLYLYVPSLFAGVNL